MLLLLADVLIVTGAIIGVICFLMAGRIHWIPPDKGEPIWCLIKEIYWLIFMSMSVPLLYLGFELQKVAKGDFQFEWAHIVVAIIYFFFLYLLFRIFPIEYRKMLKRKKTKS